MEPLAACLARRHKELYFENWYYFCFGFLFHTIFKAILG